MLKNQHIFLIKLHKIIHIHIKLYRFQLPLNPKKPQVATRPNRCKLLKSPLPPPLNNAFICVAHVNVPFGHPKFFGEEQEDRTLKKSSTHDPRAHARPKKATFVSSVQGGKIRVGDNGLTHPSPPLFFLPSHYFPSKKKSGRDAPRTQFAPRGCNFSKMTAAAANR